MWVGGDNLMYYILLYTLMYNNMGAITKQNHKNNISIHKAENTMPTFCVNNH